MYKVDFIELRWPGPRYEVVFESNGMTSTIAYFWKKLEAEEYANYKNETL